MSTNIAYYKQLDGLRAFAVIAVIISHWFPHTHFLNSYLPLGILGVCLFFVLSGFLITGILIKSKESLESGKTIGTVALNFFTRRSLRLFPAFYLTILIVILFDYNPNEQGPFYWHIAYLSNVVVYLKNAWIGRLSHFWTLAVEEQFYFIWFWIVILVHKKYLKAAIFSFLAMGLLFRFLLTNGDSQPFFLFLTPACFDCFAFGALIAVFKDKLLSIGLVSRVILLTLFVILYLLVCKPVYLGFSWNPDVYVVFLRFILSGIFMLLIAGALKGYKGLVGSILESSPIVFLGRISYGLYLYHMFVPFFVEKILKGRFEYLLYNIWLKNGLCFMLLVMFSWLSWSLMEAPVNKLKSKFE